MASPTSDGATMGLEGIVGGDQEASEVEKNELETEGTDGAGEKSKPNPAGGVSTDDRGRWRASSAIDYIAIYQK